MRAKGIYKVLSFLYSVTFETSFAAVPAPITIYPFLLVNQHLNEKKQRFIFLKSSILNTSNRTKLIHKYAKGLKVVEMRLCLWSFLSPSINTQRRSYPILMFTE